MRGSPALILLLLLLTGVLSTYWIYDRSTAVQSLREEVDVANTRRISQSLEAFRTLYTSEVVQRLQGKGLEITHDYIDRDDAIPLPATMTKLLGEEISREGSDVTVRLFSEYPFRPRGRELDAWELDALAQLEAAPDLPVWSNETIEGTRVIRYATADMMRESCVRCHNTHVASPKRDWKVGDVRGVLEVIVPVAHRSEAAGAGLTNAVLFALSAMWILITGLLLGLLRSNQRLSRARQQAEAANIAKSEFLANMSHVREVLRTAT